MIFGANRDKGIRLNGLRPEVVKMGENGVTEADLWVHDAHDEDPTRAFLLSRMEYPLFPVPVGILRSVQRPVYDALVNAQVDEQKATRKANLQGLLNGRSTWVVG